MLSLIKKNTWWVLLLVLIGSYFYFQKKPCETPIEYKIGTIDGRFGVSLGDFKNDISQAKDIWGKAINKDLFEYNPNGALTIDLVFDTRQQITQQENVLNATISQTSQVAASVKQQYSALQARYQTARQAYTTELVQYNQAQDDYNSQVNHWNSLGGAPKAVFDALTIQKNELDAQKNSLDVQRQEVNQLADQINVFIDKYNVLVDSINSNVSTINNDGLSGTQFEEGVYISDENGTRINIFQFSNQVDLIRVLAHELGHALQLQHNTNPNSIMNPVNQSNTLTLSKDDLAELQAECGLK